ncbi:MAG: hypothetical protein ACR2P7_01155 [bacterium]
MITPNFNTLTATQKLRTSGVDEPQAEAIVGTIVESQTDLATKTDIANLEKATKADLAHLEKATKADILNLEKATHAALAHFEKTTHASIANLETTTKAEIAELKNALLLQGGGMMVAIAGLILAAIRFLF